MGADDVMNQHQTQTLSKLGADTALEQTANQHGGKR